MLPQAITAFAQVINLYRATNNCNRKSKPHVDAGTVLAANKLRMSGFPHERPNGQL